MESDSTAVLICKHIYENPELLCYAFRDTPLDADDSGWQFLCNSSHQSEEILLVSFKEALTISPCIQKIIYFPPPCSFKLIKTEMGVIVWEKVESQD